MLFANMIMYFIILATASTLHASGNREISSASEAAEALRPFAGDISGLLFAVGITSSGFLAVPIMTTGAAYDICQTVGWKHGLHAKPREAKKFYLVIVAITFIALGINFIGINPMK